MKILFFNIGGADPILGGVQAVTYHLAHYFKSLGHEVYILSILRNTDYQNPIQFYFPNQKKSISGANKEFLVDFISQKHIEIVVNQTCLEPQWYIFLLSIKQTGVKLISVFHNSPYGMYGITGFPRLYNAIGNNKIRKKINQLIHVLFKIKYGRIFNKMLQYSDRMVMLSDKFISEFLYFSNSKFHKRIISISNPVTANGEPITPKEKIVLFVGRLCQQKGVYMLLKVWENICRCGCYKDWKLVIVGDGELRKDLEKMAIQMRLSNYSFEGFQKPDCYYDKAKIFCMPSMFEGFGLVLVEAMHYGVVPMAFNSFPNCSDIIDDNKNGFLVTPFSIEEYTHKLMDLMENVGKWEGMSLCAREKSKEYSINCIAEKWISLFEDFVKKK